MKRILIMIIVLVLAMLACGQPAPEHVLRGWTVTPRMFEQTQTPYVVQITTTPLPTLTPVYIEITNTPVPTNTGKLCVGTNAVSVYLRPSPNTDNYPITVIPYQDEVTQIGGRDGNWIFVQYEDKQGWVNSVYLGAC